MSNKKPIPGQKHATQVTLGGFPAYGPIWDIYLHACNGYSEIYAVPESCNAPIRKYHLDGDIRFHDIFELMESGDEEGVLEYKMDVSYYFYPETPVSVSKNIVTVTGGVAHNHRGDVAIVDFDNGPSIFTGQSGEQIGSDLLSSPIDPSADSRILLIAKAVGTAPYLIHASSYISEIYQLLEDATDEDPPAYTSLDDTLDYLSSPRIIEALTKLYK